MPDKPWHEQAAELLDKASKTPWRKGTGWRDDSVVDADGEHVLSGGAVGYENAQLCVNDEDLELITHAPALLRAALEEREEMDRDWAKDVADCQYAIDTLTSERDALAARVAELDSQIEEGRVPLLDGDFSVADSADIKRHGYAEGYAAAEREIVEWLRAQTNPFFENPNCDIDCAAAQQQGCYEGWDDARDSITDQIAAGAHRKEQP